MTSRSRSAARQSASVAQSFDDSNAKTPSKAKGADTTFVVPDQGAAVTKHKVISNKSGPTNTSMADQPYNASSAYWTQKGKTVDSTPPQWMVNWFMISGFIMAWDASFVLTREQHSGSEWHKYLFAPYHNAYVRVDKFYGDYSTNASPGYIAWTRSQTQMNVLEVILQLSAAALSAGPIGSVIGLIVSVSTFIKTVLYMQMIANSPNPQAVLPSLKMETTQDVTDFFLLFVLTNGWWIVIPAICIWSLSRRLIAGTVHA